MIIQRPIPQDRTRYANEPLAVRIIPWLCAVVATIVGILIAAQKAGVL